VDVTVAPDGEGGVTVKLQTDEWEVNVVGAKADRLKLEGIRSASWDERASIRAGESAGAPVFWALDGDAVTLLIGHDDETWDVAITLPVAAVDEIVRLVDASRSL
jgi:hypothetical protein